MGLFTIGKTQQPFLQRIAEGLEPRYSGINKFGENSDIDTETLPEMIWSHGGLYTFSTTANITGISSSDAGDTHVINVQGLDENWELVSFEVTLTGQTTVVFATPLIRVFRASNMGSTPTAGNVHIYITGATVSAGVPSVQTEIRGEILIDSQQTEMAIYTIPTGCTGSLIDFGATMSRRGNNLADCTLRVREFGGVFKVKRRWTLDASGGDSGYKHEYKIPMQLAAKTDILIQCDSVSSDGTGIAGEFTIALKADK